MHVRTLLPVLAVVATLTGGPAAQASTTCGTVTEAAGDAITPGLDLRAASVSLAGSDVVVTLTTTAPPDFFTYLTGASYYVNYRVANQILVVWRHVRSFGQPDVFGGVGVRATGSVAGNTVTWRFPASDLSVRLSAGACVVWGSSAVQNVTIDNMPDARVP